MPDLPTGKPLQKLILVALREGEISTSDLGLKCQAWSGDVRNALHILLAAGKVQYRYQGERTLWRLKGDSHGR